MQTRPTRALLLNCSPFLFAPPQLSNSATMNGDESSGDLTHAPPDENPTFQTLKLKLPRPRTAFASGTSFSEGVGGGGGGRLKERGFVEKCEEAKHLKERPSSALSMLNNESRPSSALRFLSFSLSLARVLSLARSRARALSLSMLTIKT